MKKRPYIIFTIIGVLLLVIAYNIKPDNQSFDEFWFTVVLNIAFVVLTIVILNFLWSCLGGEPMEEKVQKLVETFELVADGFKSGLHRVFLSSSNFANGSDKWISLLKGATHDVDMMGYSLHILTLTNQFSNTLRDLANKGVHIRVLIMDEGNKHFFAGLNFDDLDSMTAESMQGEVVGCEKCINNARNMVRKEIKDNIKFAKIKKGITECQIIRIDDTVYVTPYLYSQHTSDSPLYVYKKQSGGLYDKYMDALNTLWKKNKT